MKINEFNNSADKRILNEIKMSVIDEALKKNPRNLSLALLRSVYMHLEAGIITDDE